MSSRQRRTFLSLETSEERAAFAKELGVTQRFEALTPEERESVLYGQVFKGMSGEALQFVWGRPCREQGPAAHQTWIYYEAIFSLPSPGWNCTPSGDRFTEVQLVDGKVQWWIERVPTEQNRLRQRRRRR